MPFPRYFAMSFQPLRIAGGMVLCGLSIGSSAQDFREDFTPRTPVNGGIPCSRIETVYSCNRSRIRPAFLDHLLCVLSKIDFTDCTWPWRHSLGRGLIKHFFEFHLV